MQRLTKLAHYLTIFATISYLFSCADSHEVRLDDSASEQDQAALIVNAPQTKRIAISADTSVRSLLANTPSGAANTLQVGRSLVDFARSIVRVDDAVIRNVVGTGQLVSAQLELTLKSAIDISLRGSELGVHRMKQPWSEAGATWNCAADSSPNNLWNDCSSANKWSMGLLGFNFVPPPYEVAPPPCQ